METEYRPLVSRAGVEPRLHNLYSYSAALLVFWAVLLIRRGGAPLGPQTTIAAWLWTLHFVKRTAEAAFVHRYSKPRVAWWDAVQEYLYYWGFAVWIAWSLATPHPAPSAALASAGVVVFGAGEVGNLISHQILRRLRPAPGSSARAIPRGFLFEVVSCPHYLFEILAWAGFAMVVQLFSAFAFACVGAGILVAWATQRHRAYLREFDGREGRPQYPKRRRALVPFVY